MARFLLSPWTNNMERVDNDVYVLPEISSDTTLTLEQEFITVDASSGDVTVTLPEITVKTAGNIFWIKKTDTSANRVIITTIGTDTIHETTEYVLLNPGDTIAVVSNTDFNYDIAQVYLDNGLWAGYVSNGFDKTGHRDRSQSQMSFLDGTRTFTIEPVGDYFEIYSSGVRYEFTSAQTVQIDDTEGLWFIYFDNTGALTASQTPWGFSSGTVFTALLYWDATSNSAIFLGDERHSTSMNKDTHQYLHEVFGAQYNSGFSPTLSVDGDGSLDAHCEISAISAGELDDENLHHEPGEQTSFEMWYKSGADASWRKQSVTNALVAITGTRPDYNEWTGAVWQRTEVATTNFLLTHIFATNSYNQDNSTILVMGEDSYNNLHDAQAAAEVELASLTLAGLPTQEFIPIATVIIQVQDSYTNSYNARVDSTAEGDEFIDWRANERTGVGASTNDHGNLTGLLDDDHTQYHNDTRADTWLAAGHETTYDHDGYDSHIADGTLHFTEGSIDHGSISGLTDDDHTQYAILDNSRGAQTFLGDITVSGAFTSVGIDDNATGTRLSVENGSISLGTSGSNYTVSHISDDARLILSGGTSASVGASIDLYGSSHAAVAGDMNFKSSNNVFMKWDESAGSLTLSTGTGAKTTTLTLDSAQDATFAGSVGIGTTPTAGTLHLQTGSAGAIGSVGDSDDIVIENSDNAGLHIFSPDDKYSIIRFGTPTDATGGRVRYFYNAGSPVFEIGTNIPSGTVDIMSGNGSTALSFDAGGDATFSGDVIANGALTVNSGTSDTNSIFTSSDADCNLFINDGNTTATSYVGIGAIGDVLRFRAGNYWSVYVTDGGLGINTTPSYPLHIVDAAERLAVFQSSDPSAYIYCADDTSSDTNTVGLGALGDALKLKAGGSIALSIDDTQNGTIFGNFTLEDTPAIDGSAPVTLQLNSAAISSGWTEGADICALDFYSADGSGTGAGVRSAIRMQTEDTFGANYNLAFFTCDNTTGLTQKMTLSGDGLLTIGGTEKGDQSLQVVGNNTAGSIRVGSSNSTVSDPTFVAGEGSIVFKAPGTASRTCWIYNDSIALDLDTGAGQMMFKHANFGFSFFPANTGYGIHQYGGSGYWLDGVKLPQYLTHGITVEEPSDSEDITWFYTDVAITVTQLTSVLVGSSTPSVTVTLRHGTDRSAAGTVINTATITATTSVEDTSMSDATIPANSWIWLETTAQSGTVDSLSITMEYTED